MIQPSKSLDVLTIDQLKDPVFRRAFLKEALESRNPRLFLKALRLAVKASGKTMNELAQIAGVKREHLYRALDENGNPSWTMVFQLIQGLGYDFSLKTRKRA